MNSQALLSIVMTNVIMALAFPQPVGAADVPQAFTLDGRLYSDNAETTPLVDNHIVFTIQIMDEAKTCVVYEESQTISTVASDGYFSVQVGSNVGDTRRTTGDVGNSMVTIFQNTASIPGKQSGVSCVAPAVAASRRYVRVLIAPGTLGGGARTLSPDLALDSVPNAVVAERAESLQGLRSSDFLKVNNLSGVVLTQANLESVFASTARFNSLTALLDGTSTTYMRSNAAGGAQLPVVNGAPTSPAAGAVWFDSSDGKMKYQGSSGTVVVGAGGSGTVTSVSLVAPTSEFTVSGGAVTTSGSLSFGWSPQAVGTVLAAPAVTAGTPSFRPLVANDIPALPWSKITSGLPTTLAGYGISAGIGDLKTSTGAQQFAGSASCTAKQTLTWSSLTDTFTCTNIAGLDATAITSGTIDVTRLPASATSWTVSGSNIYYNTGKVGVGTTSPAVAVDVQGQIRSRTADVTGASIVDWNSGNIQYTSDSCHSFTFNNLVDGASYTFVVKGATSAQCDFASTGLTFHFTPANTVTNDNSHTVYTLFRAGGDVYVSWTTGL